MRWVRIMPLLIMLTGCIFLGLTQTARAGDVDAALARLRSKAPSVTWSSARAERIDIDCDGLADFVFVSEADSAVSVGLVRGLRHSIPVVVTFPLATGAQDSMCTIPVSLRTESMDYQSGAEEAPDLPGFKASKTCRAFVIDDNACDAFHFYWDHAHHRMSWWRR